MSGFQLQPLLIGSPSYAINLLKDKGISNITVISAPEDLAVLQEAHPDTHIYTAMLDERLNEPGYILHGLGDCGDRIFGTL